MKIAIIGPAFPFRGGIAHYNMRLYRALVDREHELLNVNFKRMYPGIIFPGQTQLDLSEKSFRIPSERIIDSMNPFSWLAAVRRIRKFMPDVVIFHWWQPFFGPIFRIMLSRLKANCGPRIFICHNVRPHEQSVLDGLLSKLAFSKVDRFLVHSEQDKDNLLDLKPDAYVMKNPHPIYDIFPDNPDTDVDGTDEEFMANILFFGYVRKYKGLKYLLQAMPAIIKRVNVRLKVAGEFYDDKKPYLDIISKLGIEKNVVIEDRYVPNEDVAQLFRRSDLVVVPYLEATQSGIVQISYHFSVPVIVTRVGGLPEVVWDGETGYIVEPGSAGAVADAVIDFFRNNRAEGFKKNIANRRQIFSWDNLAETLENLAR